MISTWLGRSRQVACRMKNRKSDETTSSCYCCCCMKNKKILNCIGKVTVTYTFAFRYRLSFIVLLMCIPFDVEGCVLLLWGKKKEFGEKKK